MASQQPLRVLLTAHPQLDSLDLVGPLEILSTVTPKSPTFNPQIAALTPTVTTGQNLTFQRHISIAGAYSTLSSFDVLVIPGGNTPPVIETKSEPIPLIAAFAALRDGKQRTILSVCAGSLLLADAGVLRGLTATTHPSAYDRLRTYEGVKVVEERFVVNKRDEHGVRIITSGGITCGIDASLWLVGDVAGQEEMKRVAEMVQHGMREGIVL